MRNFAVYDIRSFEVYNNLFKVKILFAFEFCASSLLRLPGGKLMETSEIPIREGSIT